MSIVLFFKNNYAKNNLINYSVSHRLHLIVKEKICWQHKCLLSIICYSIKKILAQIIVDASYLAIKIKKTKSVIEFLFFDKNSFFLLFEKLKRFSLHQIQSVNNVGCCKHVVHKNNSLIFMNAATISTRHLFHFKSSSSSFYFE